MLLHLGGEPAAQKILALKSSVHFRADFQPIAAAVLVVVAPGPVVLDNRALPFRRLRPGLSHQALRPENQAQSHNYKQNEVRICRIKNRSKTKNLTRDDTVREYGE